MLLAIDNGNTNVKFALVSAEGAIVQRWRALFQVVRLKTCTAFRS